MTYADEVRYAENLGLLADMIRAGAEAAAEFDADWSVEVGAALDQAADSVDGCALRVRGAGVVAVTTWEADVPDGDSDGTKVLPEVPAM